MANKDLGRRAHVHEEKSNAVGIDQHGCHQKHKSINACLKKVLLNDLLWQKQHLGSIAMNDEKVWFDYIVHKVTTLIFLCFCISMTATRALFKTLKKAQHRIKIG